jgi:protocatechuate 3,4-dioxygenase beta subunit
MRPILYLVAAATVPAILRGQDLHVAPSDASSRVTIAGSAEPGARLLVSGRVVDAKGRPVPNASIYAYQTDANGEYVPGQPGGSERPRLFGYLRSDPEGRYSLTTIKPGSYPNSRNPAHIHFEVSAPGFEDRYYEIVFDSDPFLSAQFRSQAEDPFGGVAIVTARKAGGGSLEVTHDMRLRSR